MGTAPLPAALAMGSVGSLLERQDFSPEELRAALAGPRGSRQPDGLLRKGLGQRELLSYLHLPKKDGRTPKRGARGEPADYATLCYREHPRAGDFSKTSLPERGRFDKYRIRPSVFKPAAGGKGFLSMQSLAAHKGQKLWRSNGSLHTLACHPPPSPGPRVSQAQARARLLHALSLDEASREPEPSLSDSSSGGSFSRSPGPFNASLGHVTHLGGSLDRASRSPKEAVNCLPEPPPPYEFSCPPKEEVLPEACEELKRGLGDEDAASPFTQVLEERQRLWLAELKRLYVERLHEVAQKAERSERALQLQLFVAEQEQRRLRKELRAQQGLPGPGAPPEADPNASGPRLDEEARWEVCQKTAEISLLKQQLREAQAELAQKLAEIFTLKTQLRGCRAQAQAQDAELARLRAAAAAAPTAREDGPAGCQTDDCKSRGLLGEAGGEAADAGPEQLRAELLQERLRGQERALRFEQERRTWQLEKERVLRYQRELQAGYLDMYRRNQALEQELRELRAPREPPEPWSPCLESSKI
ncbi:NEDD4-binding protein 3 [Sorex araneus]|uniref:NEDD4-binding protein 3 n=1 Tax=Sorex araneus TaxID=42254 RepID=UPI0003318895|nr:NEDD4-binding protein 3 [Sorex araneus]XP_054980222.1 NEDD4-binding protein 3 [Sorex araneus]